RDPRLGRAVAAARLVRRDAGDVDDAAGPASGHRAERGVRQSHHRGHQDVEGGLLLVDGVVQEAAFEAEARVVDQQVDRSGLVGETVLDKRHPAALGEVGDQHLALRRMGLGELVGQCLQAFAVARDQHEVLSAFGETEREDASDPGGGAGDEGDGAGGRRGHAAQQTRGSPRAASRSGMMVSMSTTLAVANQKGGVAKTTSVASIGAAPAELDQKVLLVDLDPQACLTFSLGIDPEDLEMSVHHVLTKGLNPAEVVLATDDGVDLMPATIELARAEADLLTRTGREHVLKGALDDLAETTTYDWVLLDCPPSLGVLTVAALTAADGVLIPLQCETLSHRGVGQL